MTQYVQRPLASPKKNIASSFCRMSSYPRALNTKLPYQSSTIIIFWHQGILCERPVSKGKQTPTPSLPITQEPNIHNNNIYRIPNSAVERTVSSFTPSVAHARNFQDDIADGTQRPKRNKSPTDPPTQDPAIHRHKDEQPKQRD